MSEIALLTGANGHLLMNINESEEDSGPSRQELGLLISELVSAHGSKLRAFVARFEFDAADADEIVADVFQLAYSRVEELAGLEPAACRAWLLRTARNLAANNGRRAATRRGAFQRLSREPMPLAAPGADDEFIAVLEALHRAQLASHVRATLAELDVEHRRLLTMYAVGCSGPEMATELGTTHGAARQRLSRARAAFRVAYERRAGDSLGPRDEQ